MAGEPAADRLMRQLDYRLHPDARRLTREEVAVVLHALADHTALEAARVYDRRETGSLSAEPRPALWPTSTSIGRWLHDTGNQLTDHARRTDV